jgi:hypothetical protein
LGHARARAGAADMPRTSCLQAKRARECPTMPPSTALNLHGKEGVESLLATGELDGRSRCALANSLANPKLKILQIGAFLGGLENRRIWVRRG